MENQNQPNGFDNIEHIVVLMLENRSFDNLLGYLYSDKELKNLNKSFNGLNTGQYSNPVPSNVNGGNDNETIPVSPATGYSVPYPDPGEEYQHVNTQLFNQIIPETNFGITQQYMNPPFNLPTPIPTPTMNGFITDYVSNLYATFGVETMPTFQQFAQIMQCFTPEQLPVMTGLAKQFAVFDNWYCSVPSQTYCNRAFWHAANSGGKVINPLDEDGGGIGGIIRDISGMASWIEDVWTLPTLFDRMVEKDISWKIYSPIFPVSLTDVIHGYSFKHSGHTHSYSDFIEDLYNGSLPQYSFVEPQFLFKHNDQHPSAWGRELAVGTVYRGEELIVQFYNYIKSSPNRDKILFIITHDEHGGCYDHVPPPSGIPPSPGQKGQRYFGFDRLGVRVPMIMVSSYIKPNTIVHEQFDHTSFIKTVCKKWGLDPLSDRDSSPNTNTFESIFSPTICNENWPDWQLAPLPKHSEETNHIDDPLNGLQKSILRSLLHIEKREGLGNTSFSDIKTIGQMMEFIKRFQ